jgi:hypothetical protein
VVLPVAVVRLALPALLDEAELFVGGPGAAVEIVNRELDAVEVQRPESIVQHQSHGLGAVALRGLREVGDGHAQLGAPVDTLELEKRDVADEPAALLDYDGQDHPVLELLHLADELPLAHPGCREWQEQEAPELRVVEPSEEALHVALVYGAQEDALPVEEYRLPQWHWLHSTNLPSFMTTCLRLPKETVTVGLDIRKS